MSPAFINVQISNEDGFAEVENKDPSDITISAYVDLVARALIGLTFSEKTIYNGFKQWCDEYEQR